jgi:hypothetical protein
MILGSGTPPLEIIFFFARKRERKKEANNGTENLIMPYLDHSAIALH